jgi:hypothetical protein
MSNEIKTEIHKVLINSPIKHLNLLSFLNKLEDKHADSIFNNKTLDKLLNEIKNFYRLDKWYTSR